ncbi:MAG: hypothetical protein NC408_08710 [Candidatus Gastranaerophilales bacterium]|nr:hypothetical protein [Candidatus Gastranaerophilales bacterium]MCM1073978.1 hypothetical protein [Bacteroides sp.]
MNSIGFGAKMPVSRIKVMGEVDGYVDEMLNKGAREINNIANAHGKDVVIAQRGDSLMVNAGSVTSMFNMKEMESGKDFFTNIINNIRANSDVGKNGLDKTLNTLA